MTKQLSAVFTTLGQIPAFLLAFNLSASGDSETLSTMSARGVYGSMGLLTRVTVLWRRVPITVSTDASAAILARLLVPLGLSPCLTAFAGAGWIIPVSVGLNRCATIRTIDFILFGVAVGFTGFANTRRIAPVFMDIDFRIAFSARDRIPLRHFNLPLLSSPPRSKDI
jgi:hypothetical protein